MQITFILFPFQRVAVLLTLWANDEISQNVTTPIFEIFSIEHMTKVGSKNFCSSHKIVGAKVSTQKFSGEGNV